MPKNNREYIRLNLEGRVFVEPAGGADANGGAAEVILCETLDVSYGGIKVGLDRRLIMGAIVPIGVELPWLEQTLHLVGEVKWCRPVDESHQAWTAGFQLLNAGDSDIAQWRELLEHV